MKAGRLYSGGIFSSFYLWDLCSQADHLDKAGPLVAGRRVVVVTYSGGIFSSFYLWDLCSQADHLHKAGPLVAGRRVVVVTSAS